MLPQFFLHIFSKPLSNDTEKVIKAGQKKMAADPNCIVLFNSDKFEMFVKLDFLKKML